MDPALLGLGRCTDAMLTQGGAAATGIRRAAFSSALHPRGWMGSTVTTRAPGCSKRVFWSQGRFVQRCDLGDTCFGQTVALVPSGKLQKF